MTLAPVTLFVYNRPYHTQKTLEALAMNESASETDLIIFADGPKTKDDKLKSNEIKKIIKQQNGFKSISLIEREYNFGLAKSIETGVTEVLNEFDRIIVIEDDLITSKYFLRFMNEGLNKYEHEKRVISIHGYIYPLKNKPKNNFFIKGADCQGWATWKRGWDLFDNNPEVLLTKILEKKLQKEFNFNNTYPYIKMLKAQIKGKNNSWAIKWLASAFIENKLTLYPHTSLLNNIGFDKKGTNTKFKITYFDVQISNEPIDLIDIPIEESIIMRKEFENFYRFLKIKMILNLLKNFFNHNHNK